MTTEFEDLLSVLSEEDLIRFRWRLKRAKLYSAAELIGHELKARELNADKQTHPPERRS